MNSFNIPELIKGEVNVNRHELVQKVFSEEKKQVTSRI
jgi:hypothetical protein